MAKFYKRGIKTFILLSCSSVLASTLEAPLVYAAETIISESQEMNLEEENNNANSISETLAYKFVVTTEENKEYLTDLLPIEEDDTALRGLTHPSALVRVIFAEQEEMITTSNEKGEFEINNFLVEEKDQFQIIIETPEGETLETLSVTVELNEAKEELEEEETEIPVEEPLEEVEEPEVVEEIEEKVEDSTEEPKVVEEEPASEEAVESVPPVEEKSTQNATTFSARKAIPADKIGKTYYYVKSGDNLKTIAESFKVTVEDLLRWNNIANANRIKAGDIISINGTNNYKNYNKETTSFSSSKQFVDYVSKYAKDIAAAYDLYASIMIAQASLETGYGTSALAAEANNLFGIKAQDGYEGYSIVMRTWEEENGTKVYTDAYFRLYPSLYDSFVDYAEKLRNGKFMWDPKFYNGTWIENTNTFKDATLFLTGRYATDSRYYAKLNNIILSNNLTRLDEKGYRDTSYSALVTKTNTPIGNVPFDQVASNNYWYNNILTVGNTKNIVGSVVTVNQVTRNGQYANIYGYNDKNVWGELGWVHTIALTTMNLNIKNVSYEAYLTSESSNINSLPLGQAGTKVVDKTRNHLNKKLKVTSQTADGAQSYITVGGQGLGWVMTADLGNAVSPYSVTISEGTFNVDSVPWGNPGFRKLSDTAKYMGEELQVIGSSHNGAYLLLSQGGTAIGWVDKRAVQTFSYTPKNEQAYITGGQYEIDSLPWGVKGFRKLGKTSQHVGKVATITNESANKAYVYVQIDGKNIGWIDKKAFGFKEKPYEAIILEGKYNIDTLPWGTPGFKKIGLTSSYLGEIVQIVGATQNGAYFLMQVKGKNIGWIDAKSAKRHQSIPVSQETYITSGRFEIDSLPWGESGFKKLGMTSSLLGKQVSITRESLNRAYAYTVVDGKPVGWIDKKAFGFSESPYQAVISDGKYEINTLPWGTPGFKRTGYTAELLGKQIEVVGSTEGGSYLLVRLNGKNVGWIDYRSVKKAAVTPVNYSKKVMNGSFHIDSLPWGTPGFKKIGTTSILVGKTVQVTLESSNKAYVYVFSNGEPMGWIDKRAFN